MKNKLKDKYDLNKYTRGFLISSINDHTVGFVAKVLATKLVHMIRSNQCTAWMIVVVELCEVGVQMNCSHYLLNELLENVEDSEEKGNTFHYSWLLILILFLAWEEPKNY